MSENPVFKGKEEEEQDSRDEEQRRSAAYTKLNIYNDGSTLPL